MQPLEQIVSHHNGLALMRDGLRTAELLFPHTTLAGCINAAVIRDTRGLELPAHDRFNHFSVSPHAAITWVFEGEARFIENTAQKEVPETAPLMARISVSGPFGKPLCSWSPGPLRSMVVGFYPETWEALTGIEINTIAERHLPAQDILSPELFSILEAVLKSADCQTGFESLQSNLLPLWQRKRMEGSAASTLISDWIKSLVVRTAFGGRGRSLRQLQRRVLAWTGQSMQNISRLSRAESTFAKALSQHGESFDLAEIAAEAGYADQSHMGREIRQVTGQSPARIMDKIETEESYWIYRLLGGRFE